MRCCPGGPPRQGLQQGRPKPFAQAQEMLPRPCPAVRGSPRTGPGLTVPHPRRTVRGGEVGKPAGGLVWGRSGSAPPLGHRLLGFDERIPCALRVLTTWPVGPLAGVWECALWPRAAGGPICGVHAAHLSQVSRPDREGPTQGPCESVLPLLVSRDGDAFGGKRSSSPAAAAELGGPLAQRGANSK